MRTSTKNASKLLSPPNKAFVDALSESPFTIFKQLSDLCYYEWDIQGDATPLSSSNDVWNRLRLHQTPLRHAPIEVLRKTPFRVAPAEDYGFFNDVFPRKQPPLAELAAALKCGVSIHDIDFMFVGPSIGYLSGEVESRAYGPNRTFVAEVIPGTNIVSFSSRREPYFQNLQNRGFQFERYVQQQPVVYDPTAPLPMVSMHIQLMRIDDTYNALMCSQIDAMDPTGSFPVEVKTHLLLTYFDRYLADNLLGRKRTIWQLLTSASPYALLGKMDSSVLIDLEQLSLSQLSGQLMSVARAEVRIVEALHLLKETMLKPSARLTPHRCVVHGSGMEISSAIDIVSHFPELLSRDITNELRSHQSQ